MGAIQGYKEERYTLKTIQLKIKAGDFDREERPTRDCMVVHEVEEVMILSNKALMVIRVPSAYMNPDHWEPYMDLHKVYQNVEGSGTEQQLDVCAKMLHLYFRKWGHVGSKVQRDNLRSDMDVYLDKCYQKAREGLLNE